ncbi:hypothetical protein P7K49_028498 [Saguinus oedipus]|uniref:Uncharacterized protein n=1 Tax=Saguinus oedipus TaxID=9490 RepID=A0ABQ9U4H9_SAGOE|nr:hypothetical protein P7K49_028498 [Saguinus oedipus]
MRAFQRSLGRLPALPPPCWRPPDAPSLPRLCSLAGGSGAALDHFQVPRTGAAGGRVQSPPGGAHVASTLVLGWRFPFSALGHKVLKARWKHNSGEVGSAIQLPRNQGLRRRARARTSS